MGLDDALADDQQAAVGIIAGAELLSHAWLHIVTAIILGTAATIAVTGLIAQALLRTPAEIQTK